MPYSDLGVLLPTESQYGNPQAYTESIRAESNKQAQYLSNMDQFYAQLDESKRQFDLNYTARSKEFEWTSGFEEKRLAQQSDIANRTLAMQEKESTLKQQIAEKQLAFQETELGFRKEQLGLETQKLQAELESLRENTGIAKQQMALQEKLGMAQIGQNQAKITLDRELGIGSLNMQQQQLSATTQSNQFAQNLQLAQFKAGLDQAFPGGVTSGESTLARLGMPQYTPSSTTPASEVYTKGLVVNKAYTPTYVSSQEKSNQARGIYY